MHKLYRHIVIVSISFSAGACSIPFLDESKTDHETTQVAAVAPSSAAVDQLLLQAQEERQQQRYEQAANLLERAMRIEPRNAKLWYELASIRFLQGLYQQAIELANRSMALSEYDSSLVNENQALIRHSKSKLE